MSGYPDDLDVRPLTTWPGRLLAAHERGRSSYSAALTRTLLELGVELRALVARRPVLEVAIPGHLRTPTPALPSAHLSGQYGCEHAAEHVAGHTQQPIRRSAQTALLRRVVHAVRSLSQGGDESGHRVVAAGVQPCNDVRLATQVAEVQDVGLRGPLYAHQATASERHPGALNDVLVHPKGTGDLVGHGGVLPLVHAARDLPQDGVVAGLPLVRKLVGHPAELRSVGR